MSGGASAGAGARIASSVRIARSSSSRSIIVRLLERGTERGETAGQERPRCGHAATHRVRELSFGQVFVVAEHQRGPLPGRQRTERASELVANPDVGE